jgi:hypothetical protein
MRPSLPGSCPARVGAQIPNGCRPEGVPTRFFVLDADTAEGLAAWSRLWRAWPGREVFAHPGYGRLFARPGDRLVCAVGELDGATILFPLVLRPLAAEPWSRPGESRWDAITPYGYGGPFAWGPGPRDEAAFWRAYEGWCGARRIVSTFARLSLFPEQRAALPVTPEVRLPNVVRTLAGGLDAIWDDYAHGVRTNVRAAERAGVVVEVDRTGARLDAFLAVYEHTMRRRAAEPFYFFPRAFFEALVEGVGTQLAFIHAVAGGEVVSSELVLVSEERVYPFLGGTRADAFPLRPNDALRHRAIEWAISQGKSAYVLGGGLEAEDGIFRHKRAFAPRGVVPFEVACLVHDAAACRELVRDRARAASPQRPWSPRPRFFPPYRA